MPRDDGSLRRGEAEQLANETDEQATTEEHLTDANDPGSTVTHSWVGELAHSVAVFFKDGIRHEHHIGSDLVPADAAPAEEPAPVAPVTVLDAPPALETNG